MERTTGRVQHLGVAASRRQMLSKSSGDLGREEAIVDVSFHT